MWAKISTDLLETLDISKTPLQIENRYKTVLKRKKKAVENNRKSGSSREEVPFETELREISNLDDSIEPEVLRSAKTKKKEVRYRRKKNELLSVVNGDNNSNPFTDAWTDAATTFILEMYREYLSQVGPMKRFKIKKAMWAKISTDLLETLDISKTPLQIENRYKTVLKRKKKAVENNRKSEFKINTNVLKMTLEQGEEQLYEKLLSDDSYAVQYVKLLIKNGLFTITDGGEGNVLNEIYRLQGDREILIYNRDINEGSNQKFVGEEKKNELLSVVNGDNNSNPFTDAWTDAATTFILEMYREYLSQVGPMKRFKIKKAMWAKISTDLLETLDISKTPLQIENRYKTVLKRKKKAVENNRKSGSSREEVPFETELREISNLDDSIEPEVLRSAKSVSYPKQSVQKTISSDEDSHSTDNSQPKKRKLGIEERKLELFKQKEEAKERRHQEKLQLLRELFGKKQTD
ncbi:hypothetical protein FQR65_LT18377 [Abscondita terminalis]|nr:hypothetical protein FQR65_LT18377 [Abscondita terminalis]